MPQKPAAGKQTKSPVKMFYSKVYLAEERIVKLDNGERRNYENTSKRNKEMGQYKWEFETPRSTE